MVSNSSEKLTLSMVSKLRRLLRNALRTVNTVKVIRSTRFQPMCRHPSTIFTLEAWYDGISELTRPTSAETNKEITHMPGVTRMLKKLKNWGECVTM